MRSSSPRCCEVTDGRSEGRSTPPTEAAPFIRTLTRATDAPPPHGRIPVMLSTIYEELGDHDGFVAGAAGFVRACQAAAEACGARSARVHTEPFFAEP